MRMLDVLTQVAHCEAAPERRVTLVHHSTFVCNDAKKSVSNTVDLAAIEARATR